MAKQFIVLAVVCCFVAVAHASVAPAPKQMRVPCVTRVRAGAASFCFIMGWEATCRSASMPTYAAFKACADDKEISKAMGPVVKCGAVPQAQRTNAVWPLAHKFCLDAEPTQAQWGAAKAAWDKQTADDKAADDTRKAAAATAAGAAAAAKGSWSEAKGKDIAGADVACLGNPTCLHCGTIAEIKTRCGELMGAGCAAFTYNAYTTCGYLKKAGFKLTDKSGSEVHIFQKM